jgi:hypothetical protein
MGVTLPGKTVLQRRDRLKQIINSVFGFVCSKGKAQEYQKSSPMGIWLIMNSNSLWQLEHSAHE